MVRHAAQHYGVHALGVTLSREQASYAREAIEADGLGHLAEVRHSDYRAVRETGFDAISSIGLMEHVGVKNYPAYFGFVRVHLREGGRLLNHCITRPDNAPRETGAFIDRYVFPDGELTGSGTIITRAQDAGLEVVHEENLRRHYAMTLRDWCANLVEHWTSAWPRSARAPRACGASTWPGRGWASSATRSSCTRCWPCTPALTATTDCRCVRRGE